MSDKKIEDLGRLVVAEVGDEYREEEAPLPRAVPLEEDPLPDENPFSWRRMGYEGWFDQFGIC